VQKIDNKFLPEMLPEVTSEDNNKILKVTNGTWSVENES